MIGKETAERFLNQMIISFSEEEEVLEEMTMEQCDFLTNNMMNIFMAGYLRFYHVSVSCVFDYFGCFSMGSFYIL